MKRLLLRTLGEWRDWLNEHHASESEVWLVFHKRHTGLASIDYEDALDRRYARKFTPRRADSRWSTVNRQRYAQLKAAGRLKPPGLERAPTDRGYGPQPERLELPSQLPAYFQAALRKHPAAWRRFEALAPSHRRRYFARIESTKREDTRARRLEEAIRVLASGKVLGLK